MEKTWIIYDERAAYGDETEATVLCTAHSLKEAIRDCKDFGFPCVVFEYDCKPNSNEIINGRQVYGYKLYAA